MLGLRAQAETWEQSIGIDFKVVSFYDLSSLESRMFYTMDIIRYSQSIVEFPDRRTRISSGTFSDRHTNEKAHHWDTVRGAS